MYVERNNKAPLCNHCCSGKAKSIAYSKCVPVALGIQHAERMRRIVIRGLPRSITFFHIISQTVRFSKNVIGHKICVLISFTTFV